MEVAPLQDLRRIRATGLLDDDELVVFRRLLHTERFSPRSTLIQQGKVEPTLFFLSRGHVNVTRETPDGEVFLTLLGPGSYFGEAALFNNQARSATVRAVGEVEVYVVTRDQFRALMDLSPAVTAKLMFSMFDEHLERLQRTSSEMLSRRTAFSRYGLNALFT